MKTKIITKIIIAAFLSLSLAPFVLAQKEEDFKFVLDESMAEFRLYGLHGLKNHILMGVWTGYYFIDKNGKYFGLYADNTQEHPYNSKNSDSNYYYHSTAFQYAAEKNCKTFNGKNYLQLHYGLMKFDDLPDTVLLTKMMLGGDIILARRPAGDEFRITDFYIDDNDEYIYLYCRTDDYELFIEPSRKFVKVRLADSVVIGSIPLADAWMNEQLFDGENFHWISSSDRVFSYNINDDFNYDSFSYFRIGDKFVLESKALYKITSNEVINFIGFQNNKIRFLAFANLYDSVGDPATSGYNTGIYEVPLFICENDVWDRFNLQAGLNLLKHPNSYWIDYTSTKAGNSKYTGMVGLFHWNDEELAISLLAKPNIPDSLIDEEDLRTMLIYNLVTKEWKKFVFPSSVYTKEHRLRCVLEWNDKLYFSTMVPGGPADIYKGLLEYTGPRYTSIAAADEGIYQEIGFRNVYPNPITHHTVTADIMCYVQDISKVELGLYNLMGQKLLDLTNKFEYSESTHTINVTFTMPDELPKGVYYLNVRKGTETRTKAIIIGK